MPGNTSIFFACVVVVDGAVLALVDAPLVVVAAFSVPPPSLHATASSPTAAATTTSRRAHERSELVRRERPFGPRTAAQTTRHPSPYPRAGEHVVPIAKRTASVETGPD